MHWTFRNVNSAFHGMVGVFAEGSRDRQDQSASEVEIIKTQSRNGPVLQIMEPVILTYTHPRERVLLNQERDANPFFHLYESLFMLSGRNEIAPLAYYAGNMSNYSDDGITQNGAYGYRWRHAIQFKQEGYKWDKELGGDQLSIIIDHLKRKPESRRAVLHMSNVKDDLLKMDTTRDQCCNLLVMFSIREIETIQDIPVTEIIDKLEGVTRRQGFRPQKFLDMTVINRSNDLIFGCLGANVVHFSFLQEYMAAHLGVDVGVYNQMSNNLHVYTENNSGFHPERWLAEYTSPETSTATWYTDDATNMVRLVQNPEVFDREVKDFVELNKDAEMITGIQAWREPFLQNVAQPMCHAFHMHKARDYPAALHWCNQIAADDWREAATSWISKRQKNWEAKQNATE